MPLHPAPSAVQQLGCVPRRVRRRVPCLDRAGDLRLKLLALLLAALIDLRQAGRSSHQPDQHEKLARCGGTGGSAEFPLTRPTAYLGQLVSSERYTNLRFARDGRVEIDGYGAADPHLGPAQMSRHAESVGRPPLAAAVTGQYTMGTNLSQTEGAAKNQKGLASCQPFDK